MKKVVIALAIVITSIVLIISLTMVLDKLNEERCYNLPLNDFYNDKTCLKYTENLDEWVRSRITKYSKLYN